MKSLLLALGLALCCLVQADWKEMTTTGEEYLGRWVNIAIACNSSDTRDHMRGMPALVANLSKPEEDLFKILLLLPMPDGCKNTSLYFRKGADGKYRGRSAENTVVTVELLKYHGEFVMSTINVENDFRTTTLHSRTVTQDPEILRKFQEECKRLGYTEDEMLVLEPIVKCELE